MHFARIFAGASLTTVVHFVLILEHALSPAILCTPPAFLQAHLLTIVLHFVLIFEHALSPAILCTSPAFLQAFYLVQSCTSCSFLSTLYPLPHCAFRLHFCERTILLLHYLSVKTHLFLHFICSVRIFFVPLHREPAPGMSVHRQRRVADILKGVYYALF